MTLKQQQHREMKALRSEIAELQQKILDKKKDLMNVTFHPEKYFNDHPNCPYNLLILNQPSHSGANLST